MTLYSTFCIQQIDYLYIQIEDIKYVHVIVQTALNHLISCKISGSN